jgi:DNA-directed RNA polymerase alpha subunit
MSTENSNTKQPCTIDSVVRSSITYEQFQDALKIVNEYKTQLEEHYKIAKKEIEGISKFANVTKETKLYDTDLSVRCLNILRANDDKLGINTNWEMKLKELSKLSMSKFLQCRIAGKKTLQELKELCFYADVKLLP